MAKNVKFLEEIAEGKENRDAMSLTYFMERKVPKYNSIKSKQSYFINKKQNGMIDETISILEALSQELRTSILRLDDFDLYHNVINHLNFENFHKLVKLLPKDMIKNMAYSKKGIGFSTTIYQYSSQDRKGLDFKDDFCKKIDFFLKIDKLYFSEIFQNVVLESVKTKKIREYFSNTLDELAENEIEIKGYCLEKELGEKLPYKKVCTEQKKSSMN